MNLPAPTTEFRDLVARLCDSELTPSELHRLEEIALLDRDAMDYYLLYLDLHGTFRRFSTGEIDACPIEGKEGALPPQLIAPDADIAGAQPLSPTPSDALNNATILPSITSFSGSWRWFVGGAAFATLGAGMLALMFWKSGGEPIRTQGKRFEPTPAVTTAYLTSSTGCAWGSESRRLQSMGAAELGEEIVLQEGIAEFRLPNGVNFSVEGPAGLVLTSPESLVLQYGKLTTHIPWPVKEFRITAGMLRMLASGAEFGVNLSGGRVDAHVFSGEVLAMNSMLYHPDLDGDADASQVTSNNSRGAFIKEVIAEGRSLAVAIQSNAIKTVRWGKATPALFATKLTMSGPLPISKPYVDAVMAEGPVGYWRFESAKESAVPSEVPTAGNLKIVGDVRLSGLAGNRVAEFPPGSASCLIGERRLDELANSDYTVELWVKPSHVHSGDVLALCATENNWNALMIELQGTRSALPRSSFSRSNPCSIRFLHRDPPAVSYRAGTSCLSSIPYSIRRWQHVVAVKRGENLELYLDGNIVAHDVDPSSLRPGLLLVLGRQDPNEELLPFAGQLDELAIYSKALSKKAILNHIKLIDWSQVRPDWARPDA